MTIRKILLTAAAVSGLGLLTAGTASAYVACNDAGECWHTDTRYNVPGVTFTYHPDDWYFHRHWEANHWHDYHEGRGYWRGGVWVTL